MKPKKFFSILLLLITATVLSAQLPYSGSFTLGGNANTFYPVRFDDGGFNNNEATVLNIGRSSVHENGSWHGSMIAQFKYHTTNWGNGSYFIDADIKQYGSIVDIDTVRFIAGWTDATKTNGLKRIIIWLRGQTTYYYYCNYPPNPYFTNGSLTVDTDTYSPKTQVDSYVNSCGPTFPKDVMANGNIKIPKHSYFLAGDEKGRHIKLYTDDWDGYINYSNFLYFKNSGAIKATITSDGKLGIGTITPTGQLEVGTHSGFSVTTSNLDPNYGYDLSFLKNTGHMLLGINYSGGQCERDFISNRAGGSTGGFAFYDYSNTGVMTHIMTLSGAGNVGIGTKAPGAKLDVAGAIRAHEVKVCLNNGCDYVFENDYQLMNLNDLKNFVTTNKHLPEVAPAAQMESEGINVSEMNALLLKKIEELTLYLIELKNEIDELQK
jgi:hypothetical protein